MFKIKNINKSFDDNHIIKDLSLDIKLNKTTVIIGSSGSGKSTLLRCLNLLSKADSGIIEYKDIKLDFSKPIKKDIANLYKSKTGMVFQDYNLFPHKTALENIALAPIKINKEDKEIANKNAEILLEKVGLKDKKDFYPNELSGGQQQRVAIARALAMKPEIMLFDEPTSALDPEIEMEILKLISEVTKGQFTNILVTHNMKFAKEISDEVIFMDDGKIIGRGSYDELAHSDNNRIKKFINTLN